MKIILDLALSADGYIATPDGDSSWVSERTEEFFKERIREAGCLVVGKTSFEQYHDVIYPVNDVLNIVLTKDANSTKEEKDIAYVSSIDDALRVASEHKCSGILIAGGASVSKTFLEKGLIDEIYFSVHSIILGEGMRPFGDLDTPLNLTLLDSKNLGDGIRQDHYRVER